MASVYDVAKYIHAHFPNLFPSDNIEITEKLLRRMIYHCRSYVAKGGGGKIYDEETKKVFASEGMLVDNIPIDLERGKISNLTKEQKEIIKASIELALMWQYGGLVYS